jgi:hypothetical protein
MLSTAILLSLLIDKKMAAMELAEKFKNCTVDEVCRQERSKRYQVSMDAP